MPEVLDTSVICKQTGRYIGWPTIAKSADESLHVTFSGDRDGHVDPFGKNYIVSSRDGGDSWSEPLLINDTPLDDRDTGLCIAPDGTLVMTWFTSHYYGRYSLMQHEGEHYGHRQVQPWSEWKAQLQKVTPEAAEFWAPYVQELFTADRERLVAAIGEYGLDLADDFMDDRYEVGARRFGYWSRRSRDGGKTWDTPTSVPVSAPHGANFLPNGDLIMIGNDALITEDGKRFLRVARSSDLGITWTVMATINASHSWRGHAARLCEPHVVATASGRLLGLSRCEVTTLKDRYLWRFTSDDGGTTWTEPEPTELLGFPPHLLRLSDDRLLLSYAIRHEPPGQRFCFSSDNGETWDVEHQLTLQDAPDGDLGYPSTAELADGTFVSVYYQKEQAGEKPSLMMTRWRN